MPGIVQTEGEHAAETPQKILDAPLLVSVQEYFGVAIRPKHVTRGEEFGAQLLVVVNLAVVRNPDSSVLVRHWLLTGRGQIDNRKTAVSQNSVQIRVNAAPVWSAVRLRTDHALDG